ncbi:MAG: hypothetical protein NTV39_04555 [Candidatus Saccharibacteria bacterium]|nr:hypothetical protein [Candidatus Saccharibacteria bacterium]
MRPIRLELRAIPRDAEHGKAGDVKFYEVPDEGNNYEADLIIDLLIRLRRLVGGTKRVHRVHMGRDDKTGAVYYEVSNGVFAMLEPQFVRAVNNSVDHVHKVRAKYKG